MPVTHTYNPSYSAGRDQEDRGLKAAQAKSSRDPISKKTHHRKGLAEWIKVGPKFKPQYRGKKKERERKKKKTG
jgi:hypothetical protein